MCMHKKSDEGLSQIQFDFIPCGSCFRFNNNAVMEGVAICTLFIYFSHNLLIIKPDLISIVTKRQKSN